MNMAWITLQATTNELDRPVPITMNVDMIAAYRDDASFGLIVSCGGHIFYTRQYDAKSFRQLIEGKENERQAGKETSAAGPATGQKQRRY